MVKKIFLFALFLFLSLSSANAADFSSADVEKFIKTYEEMMPYFDELDDMDVFEDDFGFDLASIQQGFMDAFAHNDSLKNIINKHGYSSVEQFSENSAQIIRAYIGYSAQDGFKEFEESISQMSPAEQQAFENSPFYQAIMSTKEAIADIPEDNIAAIEPYIPQLDNLFE
ncbi:hypothetical protein [Desulfonatronovibrio magnus]|uniref:hypothetical protein n=1 Tax=Desulfonatronovibrio magnus TaxID=698827 RepID=UPI0005EB453D|nr:hypothetical protein [Desulfonatronovibrio magnus]